MRLIEIAREAQVHREVYIAVLRGALTAPGSKRQFARMAGITPEYLSYLLNPFDRTPSPQVAEKLIHLLPIEHEQKQGILEHILLANERRLQLTKAAQSELQDRSVSDSLEALRHAHHIASTATPQAARGHYQIVRDSSRALLDAFGFAARNLDFVELCFLIHDAECILNHHGEALYYAKQARLVMDELERDTVDDKERFDRLSLNAIRAECVAYHNLKLEHQAYAASLEAEASYVIRDHAADWLPHIYRDRINALHGKPRFSIREAEALAARVKTLSIKMAAPVGDVSTLMIDRSLANAYLRYGNVKKANRLLQAHLDRIDHIIFAGPLHRASFFRSMAHIRWKMHDRVEWEYFIRSAITIAVQANLSHQLSEMRREYGHQLDAVLEREKARGAG